MEKSKKVLGAGIIVAAVAAAGVCFLAIKRKKSNADIIRAWTLKMKAEVLEEMKKLKEINKEAYCSLVDDIADRYRRVEKVSADEMKILAKELKSAWTHISAEIKKNS
ncbi:MAG: hypothetical protein WCS77_03945 [Elusimicrobiaceae bacterium]|jgi:hypothetical protein